jgi:hypothetical protein
MLESGSNDDLESMSFDFGIGHPLTPPTSH